MRFRLMFAGVACGAVAQLSALAAPKPVPIPMVSASDPNSVVQALTFGGFKATLSADSSGDPTILFSDTTGSSYRVWFQTCENHLKCKVLQLYCEWGVSLVTPQKLNDEWALAYNTPLTMYVQKGNGKLAGSSYVMTEPGGINRDLFVALTKRWVGDVAIAGTKFATPSK